MLDVHAQLIRVVVVSFFLDSACHTGRGGRGLAVGGWRWRGWREETLLSDGIGIKTVKPRITFID